MDASGGSRAQTSSRATIASTRAPSPSSARTVIGASPGQTTWPSTSRGISDQSEARIRVKWLLLTNERSPQQASVTTANGSDDANKKKLKIKKKSSYKTSAGCDLIWKVNMFVSSEQSVGRDSAGKCCIQCRAGSRVHNVLAKNCWNNFWLFYPRRLRALGLRNVTTQVSQ